MALQASNAYNKLKYLTALYVVLALVFGFLFGRVSESSYFVFKSSLFDFDKLTSSDSNTDLEWLDQYEVTPQKVSDYILENPGYFVDDAGVVKSIK